MAASIRIALGGLFMVIPPAIKPAKKPSISAWKA
jgi:hypothetical protein